jgi:hypothetical protein
MKTNKLIFAALTVTAVLGFGQLLSSCKEVGPAIDLHGTGGVLKDTNFVTTPDPAEAKRVMIEEFTGVQCVNCANGHATVEAIKAAHPNQVVSVALHSYFLDDVYPFSLQDLKSDKAEQFKNNFAPGVSKPQAMIDRKIFPGQTTALYIPAAWTTYSTNELALTTPVNISLTNTYNTTTRELDVLVKMQFTSAVTDPLKYTIYLSESDIVTAQLLPTGDVDTNYVHNDVMRDILTNVDGNNLRAENGVGRTYLEEFRITVPTKYNADHCKIVALVHKYGTTNEVLQAAEKPVH